MAFQQANPPPPTPSTPPPKPAKELPAELQEVQRVLEASAKLHEPRAPPPRNPDDPPLPLMPKETDTPPSPPKISTTAPPPPAAPPPPPPKPNLPIRRRRRRLAASSPPREGRHGLGADNEHEDARAWGAEDVSILELLNKHAAGKTLPTSCHWVIRAMRSLEKHYQTVARDEGVLRYRLELQLHGVSAELADQRTIAANAVEARREAEMQCARAFEALRTEEEVSASIRAHNEGMRRERDMMASELERARGEIRAHQREMNDLHGRWQEALADGRAWREKAEQARFETHGALSEAEQARSAAAAVQRSLLNAAEYRMAEEAGYQMQTIIQLAPSHPTVTSIYGNPLPDTGSADSWLKV